MPEPLLTRYMQPLLAGRRRECQALIREALDLGATPERLILDVVWPSMAQLERLFRDDRVNIAAENIASRINRVIADQMQSRLAQAPRRDKRALVVCACGESQELGAQMIGDLLEADGWDVTFLGGGAPADEVLDLVGRTRCDALIIFGSDAQAIPEVRRMIELIREIGVCPTMNVIVSGGVFGRAEGLWREVGADIYAESAQDVLTLANSAGPRDGRAPRTGLVKKRRRKRKNSTLALAAV